MLNVISKDEAVRIIRDSAINIEPSVEVVPLSESVGRISAEDIVSRENIPPYDRSTVDGFAVVAADTFGGGDSVPSELEIAGEILMGELPSFSIRRGQCAAISTGGILPDGADAVVMVEHTDRERDLCLIYAGVSPGANVVKKGDDISSGSIIVKRGQKIGIAEISALSALGIYEIPVVKRLVVSIISTGDEIVRGEPKPGQMRDVNTFLLSALCEREGCCAVRFGAVVDDKELIRSAVEECLEKSDIILVSGGSSAGARDMTMKIIDSLGAVHFHGIAMKPGKPTIFGTAGSKLIFGLPGHPLAAYFVFRLVVTEALKVYFRSAGLQSLRKTTLAANIPSNHGREEYLCVRINDDGEAAPLHTKSGLISVLSEADGFIRIPRNAEGMKKGEEVEVYPI